MNGATWIYEWGNPELATIWMERMIAFITWINLVLVFYKAWTDVQWICKSLPWQSWQKWESGEILFETILSYYSFYLWDNFIFLLILSLRHFYLFIHFIFEMILSLLCIFSLRWFYFYSFCLWDNLIFIMPQSPAWAWQSQSYNSPVRKYLICVLLCNIIYCISIVIS